MPMPIIDAAFPHYQPIVSLADSTVYGYEVLGRYRGQDGQVQSLGHLFHDPEVSDFEKIRIDRSIRSQALKRLVRETDKVLFFNLNPLWMLQNLREGVKPVLLEDLRSRKIKGDRIVIEITENVIKEHIEELKPIIRLYRNYGCRIAIDDFTFNDFDRLILLKPDIVKMSMHLLHMSGVNQDYTRLIQTIAHFSEELGMRVLFEGVENQSELENVVAAGGGLAQGYLFSKGKEGFKDDELFNPAVEEALKSVINKNHSDQDYLFELEDLLTEMSASFKFSGALEQLDQDLETWARDLKQDVLRVYACTLNGEQISANIHLEDSQVSVHPEYRGRNWGWRPFFIKNLANMQKFKRGALSDPYTDHHTRSRIVTYSFPITVDYFVFVDYLIYAYNPD